MRIRRAARALMLFGCLGSLGLSSGMSFASPHPSGSSVARADLPAKVDAAKASGKAPAAAQAKPAHSAKPAAKPSPKNPKKNAKRALPRKPGSEAGEPDEATRRIITGSIGPAARPGERAESPELRALRETDLALFPASRPDDAPVWPSDTIALDRDRPNVLASGAPPASELAPLPSAEPTRDLGWLRTLEMPDIPVRWDARVVRYLEFYKDNPHGRSMVAGWIKKSGHYGSSIRRVLREQGLPEDILWLALVESGFDPTIGSPAGAAGLWQFMPEGARIYGLTVDRWIDERLDPERSTVAAAKYLADLHQRFGGWELAFAAYNMGYGGLLASIRKYNTNDYWELSRFEAGIPYETALYVPKIVAMAIVSRNRKVFGCEDVELDPAVAFDRLAVSSGVSIHAVATAAGASDADVEALNPQVLAARTPPVAPGDRESASWVVRVPPGTAPKAAKSVAKLADQEGKLERYMVRWGESVEDIAAIRGVTKSSLVSLNGIRREEVIRPGTVLFVPAAPGTGIAAAKSLITSGPEDKPVVVVRSETWSYPDRRRVFYRPMPADTIRNLANVFSVTSDEIARWNALDPGAALHDGMTLQIYVPKDARIDDVVHLEESAARIMTAGTPEFFAHFEGQKGRRRMEIVARAGDSFKTIAKRYNLTLGTLERINQRPRSTSLAAGDKLVVYVPTVGESPSRQGKPNDADPSDVAVARAESSPSEDVYAEADQATRPASLRVPSAPPKAEPTPRAAPATKADAMPRAESATKADAMPRAESATKADSTPRAAPATKAEPTPRAESATKADSTPRAVAAQRAEGGSRADAPSKPEPPPRAAPAARAEPAPKPQLEAHAVPARPVPPAP